MLLSNFLPLASSLCLALLLTPLVRILALRWRLVDLPDHKRKVHQKPIARIGGVAVFVAFLGTAGVLAALRPDMRSSLAEVQALAPAAVLVFLTGLLDDLIGLKPWQKLAGEVVAAAVAVSAGIQLRSLDLGMHPWLGAFVTILWLVLCMNAVNLIDGLDGLACGIATLATLTILAGSLFNGDIRLAMAAALFAGAILGFLPYNFRPASIFLGDSGSLLIGLVLGCYSVAWSNAATSIAQMAAPLLVLAAPLMDTTVAILRRFLRAQPIFSADRSHIHHRLMARGFTHLGAVVSLYLATTIAAVFSLGASIAQRPWGLLLIAVFVCCALFAVQRLGYVEFRAARRVLTRTAFQREVKAQVAVQTFEDRLTCATSANDFWAVIQDASQDLGFHPVRMQLAGRKFVYAPAGTNASLWAFRMPISQTDWIELSHEVASVDPGSSVVPFAETIRKVLESKTRSLGAAAQGD